MAARLTDYVLPSGASAHSDRDLLVANRQSCTLPMHVDIISCFDLEWMDVKACCWHVVVFVSLRILASLISIAATTQPIRSRGSNPRIPLHSIAGILLDYSKQPTRCLKNRSLQVPPPTTYTNPSSLTLDHQQKPVTSPNIYLFTSLELKNTFPPLSTSPYLLNSTNLAHDVSASK